MTRQPELDRLLDAFLADGTNELADRVIDAALDRIDHTRQRRTWRVPPWASTTNPLARLAAVAAIGLLVIGGSLIVLQRGQPGLGGPSPTPVTTASPSAPPPTPTPAPTTPAGYLTTGRQIHTATGLADGRVLVAGGYALGDTMLSSAELYDAGTGMFGLTGSLDTPRGMHTATLLTDGRVLVAGGGPANWVINLSSFASAELYDPTTATFSPTGSLTTPREDHTATLLADGRVLITGGNDAGTHTVATAELYDPQTGTFTPTGSMATARGFHTATRLQDGRVLITGGDPAAWEDAGPYLASAELYDPNTGTFSATGPMAEGRAFHAATLLADGRVLVTGGVTYGGSVAEGGISLASAEIYDPATGTFTATGPMHDGRVYHTATALLNGRVLVAGGCPLGMIYANNPQFLASAEIYDPATGTFSATGPMAARRTWHMADLLADGRVLVTGGYGDTAPLALAEVYDPTTGTFSPAGPGS